MSIPDPSVGTPHYSREEFERDRFGQTGDDLREKAVGTPPSADDQTELVENHWVPYDRLQQLLTAEAELIRLRAELHERELTHETDTADLERLNAELTSLRAENQALAAKERREFAWAEEYMAKSRHLDVELERTKQGYTALLIDLRALVEQWQKHSAQILRGLTAAADPQPVQLEFEAASRIYRACADELKARLSREPN